MQRYSRGARPILPSPIPRPMDKERIFNFSLTFITSTQITDHSVKSLLQSSSCSTSTADEPNITLSAHHSILARCLSPAVAAAALLPSVDDSLSPVQLCHMETSSFQAADVTDLDVADRAVSVRLEHKELWDRFNALGTEMVITKSGR